jgi:hypothetical protein
MSHLKKRDFKGLVSDEGNKVKLLIMWPNGEIVDRLTPQQGGRNWEHAYYQGHETFHENCYSCACEEAY